MVYTALTNGIATIALLAVCGGLWFDSLSLNPLGASVLPLLVIGVAIYRSRELAPARTHLCPGGPGGVGRRRFNRWGRSSFCSTSARAPLLGWISLWQWLVMAAGAAAL